MDYEAEIRDLKKRVGDLEGTLNVLAGQIGRVQPEIAAQSETSSRRFDAIDQAMARVVARLDTMNTQVWGLRDDLPDILAEALRRSGP